MPLPEGGNEDEDGSHDGEDASEQGGGEDDRSAAGLGYIKERGHGILPRTIGARGDHGVDCGT